MLLDMIKNETFVDWGPGNNFGEHSTSWLESWTVFFICSSDNFTRLASFSMLVTLDSAPWITEKQSGRWLGYIQNALIWAHGAGGEQTSGRENAYLDSASTIVTSGIMYVLCYPRSLSLSPFFCTILSRWYVEIWLRPFASSFAALAIRMLSSKLFVLMALPSSARDLASAAFRVPASTCCTCSYEKAMLRILSPMTWSFVPMTFSSIHTDNLSRIYICSVLFISTCSFTLWIWTSDCKTVMCCRSSPSPFFAATVVAHVKFDHACSCC